MTDKTVSNHINIHRVTKPPKYHLLAQNYIEEDDQELQNLKEEIKDNLSDIRSNDDEDELSDAELKDVVTDNAVFLD